MRRFRGDVENFTYHWLGFQVEETSTAIQCLRGEGKFGEDGGFATDEHLLKV